MLRRCCLLMFVAALGLLASCQRAQQYKAVPKDIEKKDDGPESLFGYSWLPPQKTYDVPIVFVPSTSAEWSKLDGYWNAPPFPGGLPTLHIGLPPLQIAAAWALTEHHTVVKIKVPLGLPDPTPHIPALNPPTYGKWRLGKALFFTPIVKTSSRTYKCATCHDPGHGFAEDPSNPALANYNTLSLINVVYNRRQFWDGRVDTLEETLFRSLDDEKKTDANKRLERGVQEHVWGGFVRALVDDKRHDKDFELIFGVNRPTQDTVAQALATYIRTILSGDSLFDRAAKAANGKKLTAASFQPFLDKDEILAASLRDGVGSNTPATKDMPELLAKGYELFYGPARCAQCHTGPLFTDHDFHNVGYRGKEREPEPPTETGRALRVPVGLKESRLIGAFRTPTLRNLLSTNPYFHEGKMRDLREVVEFYDRGIHFSKHLAAPLKNGASPQYLKLTPPDEEALVIFLRALQGRPVDPIVTTP